MTILILPVLLLSSPLQAAMLCPGLETHIEAIDQGSRCLTVPLMAAWDEASALGETPCLSQALESRGLPSWEPPPIEARVSSAHGGPTAAAKSLRSTYSAPNYLESTNFVIWWGTSGGLDEGDLEPLIEAFEEGWSYYDTMLGMPMPEGSDSYKFNVYIGDSGSGMPSSYGAGGYSTYDRSGYPMIVIALDSLSDIAWAESTAVHEFFHATQSATGAFVDYSDGSDAAWYWEATAVWAEAEVYPENYYYSVFLFGFAYIPYYPLNWFNYPDRGTIDEYHQYGAFIFPRYLSEIEPGEYSVVSDAWLTGGSYDDPLEVLDDLLRPHGTDVLDVWADFIAHNAFWDYEDGSDYKWMLDYYAGYYDDESIARSYSGEGPSELTEAPGELPQRYGASYICITNPDEGELLARVEGDSSGSSGGSATWVATLALKASRSVDYVPLEFTGTSGSATVRDASDYQEICLAVGAWTSRWRSGEEFDYRYSLAIDETKPDTGDTDEPDDTGDSGDTEDPTDTSDTSVVDTGSTDTGGSEKRGGLVGARPGCGCSGGPSSFSLFGALLGLVSVWGRRRRA